MRAATRAAISIADTTEEAVNIKENIPEPVEKADPVENAENNEKKMNAIRTADILYLHIR